RFERALAHDARHYRAIANLGNLELEGGNPAAAVERYREAIRINPDYSTAHHNLAAALRRQGKIAASVTSLKRAQKLSVKESQPTLRGGSAGARTSSGGARRGYRWDQFFRWFLIVVVVLVAYRLLLER
ncbi:MAG TPA: tetratricopeptide repeat protein, partial [Deinococcales bacterium]|nr:tetratricopeptide repeat protein [Deinococcales bacterium]